MMADIEVGVYVAICIIAVLFLANKVFGKNISL